ncbi:MAG: tetratricopeptide repeat protein, partial [Candidatus Delongbacteria bacterium]|nr:tetratricopeptide repeat protein [Candidatus Delongbacteria bacterium]
VSIRHTIETIAFKVNKEYTKPLVIYFDDCQWLDEPSQSLLKNFIASINAEEKREKKSNKNLIFLLTYRPEFEVFKEFNFDSRFTEFPLKPLTTENSKELIDSMLGKNNIPDAFIGNIMENSAGNPFYIEELVSYLIEKEKVIIENDSWIISDEVENIQIPLSLNSIILSRVDNLNDEFKNILQKASVIGHHFFKTILREVSNKIDNTDFDKDFSRLVNDNWFYGEQDEDKYFFKHILTTDVCYNAILKYNKRILHKIIAETAEEIFKDNKEYFLFIANHYEKSDPVKGAKEFDKMLEYLEKAGGHAKDNYENKNAIRLFDKLLSYDIANTKIVEIELEKVDILELTGKWGEAEVILNNCLEKANEIEDDQLIAKTYRFLGIISWRIGKNKDAMKFHNKSLEYYKILDDENGISECYGNIGNMFYSESEYSKAMEYYEKKLSICKKLDNKKGFAKAVGNMGIVHWVKEDYKKAMEFFKLDLDMCEKMGDKIGYANTIGNMGLVYSEKHDYVNTMQCYEKKISICEEIGNKQGVSTVIGSIGLAYESNGEYDKAMECYKKYLKLAEELGDKEGISIALDHVGSIYFEKGKYQNSIDCYNRSIELGRELNIKYYLCSYLYFKANAMYMLNDTNAYSVNEEALELSLEVDRKEGVFLSTVLKEKLGFMISEEIEKKKEFINNLKNLLTVEEDDDKDEDVIAALNYEIALLLNKLNEDYSEYKERSIGIFKKLYKTIPNIAYSKRIQELEKL